MYSNNSHMRSFYTPFSSRMQSSKPKESGIHSFLKVFSKVPLVPKKVGTLERGAIGLALTILSVLFVVIILGLIPLYQGLNDQDKEFSFEIDETLAKSEKIFGILSKKPSELTNEDKVLLQVFKDDFIERFGNVTDTKLLSRIERISVVDVKPHKDNLVNVKLLVQSKPLSVVEKVEMSKRMNSYCKKLNSDLVSRNHPQLAKQHNSNPKESEDTKGPVYEVLNPKSDEWNYLRNVEESKLSIASQQEHKPIIEFIRIPSKLLGSKHSHKKLSNKKEQADNKYKFVIKEGIKRVINATETSVKTEDRGVEVAKEEAIVDASKVEVANVEATKKAVVIEEEIAKAPKKKLTKVKLKAKSKEKKVKSKKVKQDEEKKPGFFRRLISGITFDKILLASNFLKDGLEKMGVVNKDGELQEIQPQNINKLSKVLKNMYNTATFNEIVDLQLKQRKSSLAQRLTDDIASYLNGMIDSQGSGRGSISLPESLGSLNKTTVNEVLKSVVSYLREYKDQLKLNNSDVQKIANINAQDTNSLSINKNILHILLKSLNGKQQHEIDAPQDDLINKGINFVSKLFANKQTSMNGHEETDNGMKGLESIMALFKQKNNSQISRLSNHSVDLTRNL